MATSAASSEFAANANVPTAALTNAFAAVGTFTFTANSLDAALVATLQPGNYTVVVSPSTGATGLGLVEVYEVP